MEDVKSRGPFIYSVLESAQAFLAQHPFQESEETLADGKGLPPSALAAKCCASQNVKVAHLPSPGDASPKVQVVGSGTGEIIQSVASGCDPLPLTSHWVKFLGVDQLPSSSAATLDILDQ